VHGLGLGCRSALAGALTDALDEVLSGLRKARWAGSKLNLMETVWRPTDRQSAVNNFGHSLNERLFKCLAICL